MQNALYRFDATSEQQGASRNGALGDRSHPPRDSANEILIPEVGINLRLLERKQETLPCAL
jgi:hypothetical protein